MSPRSKPYADLTDEMLDTLLAKVTPGEYQPMPFWACGHVWVPSLARWAGTRAVRFKPGGLLGLCARRRFHLGAHTLSPAPASLS